MHCQTQFIAIGRLIPLAFALPLAKPSPLPFPLAINLIKLFHLKNPVTTVALLIALALAMPLPLLFFAIISFLKPSHHSPIAHSIGNCIAIGKTQFIVYGETWFIILFHFILDSTHFLVGNPVSKITLMMC